ncbi:MAG: hypothetical protein ACREBO_01380 [Novosphingobium sp.]
MSVLLTAALLFAAEAVAASPGDIAEPNPRAMSQGEIRAYNAKLGRDDPNYIKCKRSADTGSLIARNYSCRTNRQWAKAEDIGNENAREIGDEMKSKSWNTSG